jgi:hypothetical protein
LQDKIERRAVLVGPGLSETGDRAIDDAWIHGLGFVVVEPSFVSVPTRKFSSTTSQRLTNSKYNSLPRDA